MILNLPDIDWTSDSESIEGNQNSNAINTAFLSAFQELGLTQIVDFPTRLHNTLNLFLTNRPSMISKCTPLPGVGDHEMVLTVSNTHTKRQKPIRRKILLWNKADTQKIRDNLSTLSEHYLATVTINTPVEEQWEIISLDTSNSWLEGSPRPIKRQSSSDARDWRRYKTLTKSMQFYCRRTYQQHIYMT